LVLQKTGKCVTKEFGSRFIYYVKMIPYRGPPVTLRMLLDTGSQVNLIDSSVARDWPCHKQEPIFALSLSGMVTIDACIRGAEAIINGEAKGLILYAANLSIPGVDVIISGQTLVDWFPDLLPYWESCVTLPRVPRDDEDSDDSSSPPPSPPTEPSSTATPSVFAVQTASSPAPQPNTSSTPGRVFSQPVVNTPVRVNRKTKRAQKQKPQWLSEPIPPPLELPSSPSSQASLASAPADLPVAVEVKSLQSSPSPMSVPTESTTPPVAPDPIALAQNRGLTQIATELEVNAAFVDTDKFVADDSTMFGIPFVVQLQPDHKPYYRSWQEPSFTKAAVLDEYFQKLLDKDVIEQAASADYCLGVIVVEKDGKTRPCLDSRPLNDLLVRVEPAALPSIWNIIHSIGDFVSLCKLDLTSCFHQFELDVGSRQYFTFKWRGVPYRFKRLPFGYANAPALVQTIMRRVFHGFSDVFVFLDDIVVVVRKGEDHDTKVAAVLRRLNEFHLRLNIQKCDFFATTTKVLGVIVTPTEILADESKIRHILKLPYPANTAALRSFLGGWNFFRTYVPRASTYTAPFDAIANGRGAIHWTPLLLKQFDELREALASHLRLQRLDELKDIFLVTDASDVGISGWIAQRNSQDILCPVHCTSRVLSPTERRYSTTDRELLSIVYSTQVFSDLLYGRRVICFTDHKALYSIVNSPSATKQQSSRRSRWLEHLNSFDLHVETVTGESNRLADILSRAFSHLYNGTLEPEFDVPVQPLVLPVVPVGSTATETHLQLRAPPPEDRERLILATHSDNGHFGVNAVVLSLRQQGYQWRRMHSQVEHVLGGCLTCAKYNWGKTPHHPAKTISASQPMAHVQVDIKGPWSPTSTDGFSFILVLVDVFSRYTLLRPLRTQSAPEVARQLTSMFFQNSWPSVLQSDNGQAFISEVLEHVNHILRVEHRRVTPYYPQGNAIVERRNGDIGPGLAKLQELQPQNWPALLDGLAYFINARIDPRTHLTPFFLMTGRHPQVPVKVTGTVDSEVSLESVQHWVSFLHTLPLVHSSVSELQENLYSHRRALLDARPSLVTEALPVGTYVLIRDETRQFKSDPKFSLRGIVERVTKGGSYVIKDVLGSLYPRHWNITQLRPLPQLPDESCFDVVDIEAHHTVNKFGDLMYSVLKKGDTLYTWLLPEEIFNTDLLAEYWRSHSPSSADNRDPDYVQPVSVGKLEEPPAPSPAPVPTLATQPPTTPVVKQRGKSSQKKIALSNSQSIPSNSSSTSDSPSPLDSQSPVLDPLPKLADRSRRLNAGVPPKKHSDDYME
jgi:transposase InsO family protein